MIAWSVLTESRRKAVSEKHSMFIHRTDGLGNSPDFEEASAIEVSGVDLNARGSTRMQAFS